MTRINQLLINILRASFQDIPLSLTISEEDLSLIVKEAEQQGVVGLVFNALGKLPKEQIYHSLAYHQAMSGYMKQTTEYAEKRVSAQKFASALSQKGVQCMVLKGMSFSLYYPKPEVRSSSDCDVYLGEGFETGNKIAVEIGGRYERGTYKHSHLFIDKLMIENHHYLTDFDGTKQGKKIEYILEKVIKEALGHKIGDTDLICPNDHFNALFLIKHAHGNFMEECMSLRMIYDWCMLLRCKQDELPWECIYQELTECKLRAFADIMTSLCVDYLGLELTNPAISQSSDKKLVAEIMEDTLNGGIHTKSKETFWLKCIRIFRRFMRIWHYRNLATESYLRMIWNNFAYSSYLKRDIELEGRKNVDGMSTSGSFRNSNFYN